MIITTAQNVEGKSISEYLGIVSIGTLVTMPNFKEMKKKNVYLRCR